MMSIMDEQLAYATMPKTILAYNAAASFFSASVWCSFTAPEVEDEDGFFISMVYMYYLLEKS